jgi:hypothetical protein
MIDFSRPMRAVRRARSAVLTRVGLPQLIDPAQEARFQALAPRFRAVRDQLAESVNPSHATAPNAFAWGDWERSLAERFAGGLPVDFLHDPTLANTMVFGATARLGERLARVRAAFPGGVADDLLLEDALGRPTLCDRAAMTSANRAHHAYHLATHAMVTGRPIFGAGTIVEWGGGYGDLARIVRRMNRNLTYVILDLPALGAVQWVYLSALEGEDAVHLVTADDPAVRPGKVNLVASSFALDHMPGLSADAFVSTWALTESPPALQEAVVAREFFGAQQLLVAYTLDGNNAAREPLAARGCVQRPVSILTREGLRSNEYALR